MYVGERGLCICECRYTQRPEGGVRRPGINILFHCKLSHAAAGNSTLLFFKISVRSYSPSCLSSPTAVIWILNVFLTMESVPGLRGQGAHLGFVLDHSAFTSDFCVPLFHVFKFWQMMFFCLFGWLAVFVYALVWDNFEADFLWNAGWHGASNLSGSAFWVLG